MGNRKKWLLTGLAPVIAVSMAAAGCSNGSNESKGAVSSSASPSASASASPSAGADPGSGNSEKIQLTWMMNDVVLLDAEGIKYVEEKFNVDLNVIAVARADYAQRQQIMLTSGDVPDVMIVMDPNELKKYADQGLLAEVPMETIAQYAPKTKAEFDKNAPQGWYYTEQNGVNYGIPTLYGGKFTTPVAWRTDLLEKAGVTKIPETIDEMTEAFAALKKIGVYGTTSNGNSDYAAFQKIFGAYGTMPTQWMVKDGKVVNGAVVPEAKEALAKLAEWYKLGYIDPEFVTGKDLAPKFTDGVYAFNDNANVNSLDIDNPNSAIATLKNVNPDGKIEFGPMPKGPRGDSGGWSWGTASNSIAFGAQLEKEPEKLQRALEIIESTINDEDVFVRLAYGEQGKHWDFANGTDLTEGVKYLPPYDDAAKLKEEGIKAGETFFGGKPNFEIFYKYYGDRFREINEQYADHPIADIFGKPDILPSSGQYWGDLKKLKIEAYAKIIRGDEPVDYFDSFVKQWNEMGGAKLQEEAQALYDSAQ